MLRMVQDRKLTLMYEREIIRRPIAGNPIPCDGGMRSRRKSHRGCGIVTCLSEELIAERRCSVLDAMHALPPMKEAAELIRFLAGHDVTVQYRRSQTMHVLLIV